MAVACSVLIHLAVMALPWGHRASGLTLGTQGKHPPVVLNLRPPEPEAPRQLVDVHTPATAPVAATDLIALEDSNATDLELRDGTKPGPHLEETSGLDALAAPSAAKPPAEPVPPPSPAPAESAPALASKKPVEKSTETSTVKPSPPDSKSVQLAKAMPPEIATPEQERTSAAAPPQHAPPASMPDVPEGGARFSRGRVYDKVDKQGIPGFEAMQSEVAPYLHEVRRKVERRWNAMLLTRYSGTSPSEVLIDCAIASDGRIAYVNVVGQPADRVYAALCKEAVEKAGPFKPFPFKVPDMYRNKNLEIRWTFNFL